MYHRSTLPPFFFVTFRLYTRTPPPRLSDFSLLLHDLLLHGYSGVPRAVLGRADHSHPRPEIRHGRGLPRSSSSSRGGIRGETTLTVSAFCRKTDTASPVSSNRASTRTKGLCSTFTRPTVARRVVPSGAHTRTSSPEESSERYAVRSPGILTYEHTGPAFTRNGLLLM